MEFCSTNLNPSRISANQNRRVREQTFIFRLVAFGWLLGMPFPLCTSLCPSSTDRHRSTGSGRVGGRRWTWFAECRFLSSTQIIKPSVQDRAACSLQIEFELITRLRNLMVHSNYTGGWFRRLVPLLPGRVGVDRWTGVLSGPEEADWAVRCCVVGTVAGMADTKRFNATLEMMKGQYKLGLTARKLLPDLEAVCCTCLAVV